MIQIGLNARLIQNSYYTIKAINKLIPTKWFIWMSRGKFNVDWPISAFQQSMKSESRILIGQELPSNNQCRQ